jgi:hypothetical protein
MRRIIDPSRFAEDVAIDATTPKQVQHKTDAESVEDWEDEGGASGHSSKSAVAHDLSLVPGNELNEETKCT